MNLFRDLGMIIVKLENCFSLYIVFLSLGFRDSFPFLCGKLFRFTFYLIGICLFLAKKKSKK